MDLMCDRLFWPHMAVQAKEHIGKCCPCLAFKARQPKAPLENIMATHPLELVHLDFLCLEPGKGQEENVLIITDHFTRHTLAYVTRTQMAQTMAKTLWDKFNVHYGLPEKILTDQGRNFESLLVADLCELMGVQKIWTSLYHLQTNGQCERFDSTLINMLGTLPKEKKSEWKNHIGTLVHACNCFATQPQGSAPTTSCSVDNLTFQLMWHLVWLHAPSQSQTQPSLFKSSENETSGLMKKRKPFRQRRPKGISIIMIKKVELWPWKLGTQSWSM